MAQRVPGNVILGRESKRVMLRKLVLLVVATLECCHEESFTPEEG